MKRGSGNGSEGYEEEEMTTAGYVMETLRYAGELFVAGFSVADVII